MKSGSIKRYLPIICSLAVCALTIQAQADWYDQRSAPNYNPGYGDFPPKSIDQQLQNRNTHGLGELERMPQDSSRDSNRVVDRYQPEYQDTANQQENNPTKRYNSYSSTYQYPDTRNLTPGYDNYGQNGHDNPYQGGNSGFNNPRNRGGSGTQGPWNNQGSGFNPWGRRGGWSGNRDPFGGRGPSEWLTPDKRSLSRNWDDMLNAPARSGEMPGGWEAPSVSVPNPAEVGDELEDASRELPDQMDNFNWNDFRR